MDHSEKKSVRAGGQSAGQGQPIFIKLDYTSKSFRASLGWEQYHWQINGCILENVKKMLVIFHPKNQRKKCIHLHRLYLRFILFDICRINSNNLNLNLHKLIFTSHNHKECRWFFVFNFWGNVLRFFPMMHILYIV